MHARLLPEGEILPPEGGSYEIERVELSLTHIAKQRASTPRERVGEFEGRSPPNKNRKVFVMRTPKPTQRTFGSLGRFIEGSLRDVSLAGRTLAASPIVTAVAI